MERYSPRRYDMVDDASGSWILYNDHAADRAAFAAKVRAAVDTERAQSAVYYARYTDYLKGKITGAEERAAEAAYEKARAALDALLGGGS